MAWTEESVYKYGLRQGCSGGLAGGGMVSGSTDPEQSGEWAVVGCSPQTTGSQGGGLRPPDIREADQGG